MTVISVIIYWDWYNKHNQGKRHTGRERQYPEHKDVLQSFPMIVVNIRVTGSRHPCQDDGFRLGIDNNKQI